MNMKRWLTDHKLAIIGAVTGAIAGLLYWKFVGCSSGTCMISSKPLNSAVYFSVTGALIFSVFKKEKEDRQA